MVVLNNKTRIFYTSNNVAHAIIINELKYKINNNIIKYYYIIYTSAYI